MNFVVVIFKKDLHYCLIPSYMRPDPKALGFNLWKLRYDLTGIWGGGGGLHGGGGRTQCLLLACKVILTLEYSVLEFQSWWNLYGPTSWLLPLQSYFRSNIKRGYKGEVGSNLSSSPLPSCLLLSHTHTTIVITILRIKSLEVGLKRFWYQWITRNLSVKLALTAYWTQLLLCCEDWTSITVNVCTSLWMYSMWEY